MDTITGEIQLISSISGSVESNFDIVGNINISEQVSGEICSGNVYPLDIISGDIDSEQTIDGKLSILNEVETYDGDYVVVPAAKSSKILETKDKYLLDNITVLKVPYYQMSNQFGDTVYIASEV